MSQPPHKSDAQQPDANSTQQADSSITNNEVQGNQNRVIQGNNNQSVLGDNNIVNQGSNNTQNIHIINNYYSVKTSNASVESFEETQNTLPNKGYDFKAKPEKEVSAQPKLNPSLRKYRFEYAEVVKPSGLFGLARKPIINSHRKEVKYFAEDLGGGVELEMIAIPDGNFLMGSLEEKNASSSEFPQHQVSVNSFFMGKYPITQKEWKAVACLPQINRPLVVDCSKFKGDSYPVEQVCWNDAVEFCDRCGVTAVERMLGTFCGILQVL